MSPSEQEQPNRSSSGSIDGNIQQPADAPAGQKERKPSGSTEKTISCISCRRRKLKCDRAKPKCATCSRLHHECEYPERRRNIGSRRRNMKELEARLAQVETQLTTKSKSETVPTTSDANLDVNWDDLAMDMDFPEDGFVESGFGSARLKLSGEPDMPAGDYFSYEVISLGLQEPLPPDHMIDELTNLFFDINNRTVPMIHQYRFRAAMSLPPASRPPVALRYAIWATAAMISDKYKAYDEILYRRARKYAEDAEMQGQGEVFVSVYYAQTWYWIANFEANKTYFPRAWVNCGKCVRLTQMLGLQKLDSVSEGKRIIPPPRDWIELEERRRTFWAAFYCDRWASAGTGWPMVINEKEITTHLPASDESFEKGIKEETMSLAQSLTPEGASKLSSFGGIVLSACLFGRNFDHLHHSGPADHPEDLSHGEFWKRHRKLDNVLSSTFMFLPEHLRLPRGIQDMNIVLLHMYIHASAVCLHSTAVMTAELHNLDPNFIRQSQARTLLAAGEIANTVRLISHMDITRMNTWMGFCLYVAAGVFLQDLNENHQNSQSLSNLDFLVQAMKAIGRKHGVTTHFTTQIELNIAASKVGMKPKSFFHGFGGQQAMRFDCKMVPDSVSSSSGGDVLPPDMNNTCPFPVPGSGRKSPSSGTNNPSPQVSLPTRSRDDSSSGTSNSSFPVQQPPSSSGGTMPSVQENDASQDKWAFEPRLFAAARGTFTTQAENISSNTVPDLASNTPSADSSSSNQTSQNPHMPGKSTSSLDFEGFQGDATVFDIPPDWTFDSTQMPLNANETSAVNITDDDIDFNMLAETWNDVNQVPRSEG